MKKSNTKYGEKKHNTQPLTTPPLEERRRFAHFSRIIVKICVDLVGCVRLRVCVCFTYTFVWVCVGAFVRVYVCQYLSFGHVSVCLARQARKQKLNSVWKTRKIPLDLVLLCVELRDEMMRISKQLEKYTESISKVR